MGPGAETASITWGVADAVDEYYFSNGFLEYLQLLEVMISGFQGEPVCAMVEC